MNTIILDEILLHLRSSSNIEIYEWFVSINPTPFIRVIHDRAKTVSEEAFSGLEMAIMTFIAIGGEKGKRLESEFPEYKFANPKYTFGSTKDEVKHE